MGKIRKFFDTWLNPNKLEISLEEACKKYNINAESARILLETANGVQWTGFSEKEPVATKKNKGKNIEKAQPQAVQERGNVVQEKNHENSNNFER